MQYQDSPIDVNDIDIIPSLRALNDADKQTLLQNDIELVVPLKAKERLTGMIMLAQRVSGKPYSTEERNMLETVAHHAAMALENARLYDELKQQLISSSKLASLGELAAYVAHEVNNGLQAVINFGSILHQDLTDDNMKADCKVIETEALRARNIVETLLGIARKERLGKTAVDVNDLVRSVVTLARLRAKSADVTVEEDYSPEALFIEGSAEQLRQVFLNLFANATDAMPGGGTITVRTAARENEAVVSISDTGMGISRSDIERIFEPLFTTKSNGTGLGLTVSLSIVREHGGDLSIASEVNKGTTFTVTLPRVTEAKEEDDG